MLVFGTKVKENESIKDALKRALDNEHILEKFKEDNDEFSKKFLNALFGDSDEEENCLVLNGDMEYQDISYNPKDMQLLELKKENNTDVCKLFNVDPALLNGNATEEQFLLFVKTVILPLFKQFEEVLNKNLLLESEKNTHYFAFDTRELLKADILKRYQAYEIGLRNSFLELNDVRYMENMDKLEGFDNIVKLGLDTVLYNTQNKDIFVANTNTSTNVVKGGEENGNT